MTVKHFKLCEAHISSNMVRLATDGNGSTILGVGRGYVKLIGTPYPPCKTLYKTQIRELRDEGDEKSKLCKDMQQRLAEYEEER